jgi:hypothetical protein
MRCKVKDCENYMHQGWFIDFLCAPCHNFLSTGEGTTSQLYRNTVAAEREACAVIAFNAKTYLEAAAAIRARGQV